MTEMIAYCGLACHACVAYQATLKDDDSRRQEIAGLWSKMYGSDLEPGDINCAGCLSSREPLFAHCRVCDVRQCAGERGLDNCAHCPDYACEKLESFFKLAPEAKTHLETIRARG